MDEEFEKRAEAIKDLKNFEDKIAPIELERATTQEFYQTSLFLIHLQTETAKKKVEDLRESKKKSKACGTFKIDTAKLKRTRKANASQNEPETLESLEKEYQLLLAKRHFFLRQTQINKIELPLLEGTVDVLTKTELKCISNIEEAIKKNCTKAINVKHTFSMDEIEKGSKVKIDYDAIRKNHGLINNVERLEGSCQFLRNTVNAHISQQNWNAETATRQLIHREGIRDAGDCAAKWKRQFANNKIAEIKVQRLQAFNSFFQKVSGSISALYKDICADPSREAFLEIPPPPHGTKKDSNPWKRLRFSVKKDGVNVDYQELSGGEQTMAEIALKIAVAEAIKTPILFLDSIDNGVHMSNSKRLVPFLARQSKRRQIVVCGCDSEFYKVLAVEKVCVLTIQ